MSVGLNYIKMPRNVSEYTLMKGVTDYSNLKQFDLYETGYSFLTVVSVPRYMQLLAAQDAKVKNCRMDLSIFWKVSSVALMVFLISLLMLVLLPMVSMNFRLSTMSAWILPSRLACLSSSVLALC